MEMDIDSDEDTEIQDLRHLNAVLESDKPLLSESVSQSSASTASSYCSSKTLQYSKIEAALSLNKLTDEKLRRLEKILFNRLSECRQKLSEIQGSSQPTDRQDKQEKFRYVFCGKPYFKDKSNFPAPDNEDTIIMTKSQMYDFSCVSSVAGWTVKDKSEFIKLLKDMSISIKKNELNSKIAQLHRDAKSQDSRAPENKIAAIRKEIDNLKRKTLQDLVLPIDKEYDWETVANKLTYRHSAQEYRSLWKLFLHPSINKTSWSKKEHLSLQEIAHNHKLQDWDEIAKELNTCRTGYQCFVYFRTNMSNTFTGQKWTKEEEEYLKRLIDYYKEDNYIPWGKVAASMENRTKIQIYNKYSRLMEQRKGRFLLEEDAVILTCVDNFGTNFKKIIQYLPGRSTTQLRMRYNVLTKRRISTVWTEEEDKKLIQLMANQDSATHYSNITKYFPGKDRVHIRCRYLTLQKWMRKNPNLDLADAPRRGARRLDHGRASDNLNKAIEKLKKRIQSEVENRKSTKVTKDSPEEVIDDAIVVTLLNENIRESKKSNSWEEEQFIFTDDTIVSTESLNVTNLQRVLVLLKAKLNKDMFKNSCYNEQYPALIKKDQEVSLVKVRCYSKKDTTQTIKISGSPDIWGHISLGSTEYVLPPHYATITGCRKLMAYVSASNNDFPLNRNICFRRNVILKEQMYLLLERFNTLFLWPMLLSNEGPNLLRQNVQPNFNYKLNDDKAIGILPSVTIPDIKYYADVVDENIDLEESSENNDISIKEIIIGNNELFYVNDALISYKQQDAQMPY